MEVLISILLILFDSSLGLLRPGPCPSKPHSNLNIRRGIANFTVMFVLPFETKPDSHLFKVTPPCDVYHAKISPNRFKLENRDQTRTFSDIELLNYENGELSTLQNESVHIWSFGFGSKAALIWSCLDISPNYYCVDHDLALILMTKEGQEDIGRFVLEKYIGDNLVLELFDAVINSTQFCQVEERSIKLKWWYVLVFLPLIMVLLSIISDLWKITRSNRINVLPFMN